MSETHSIFAPDKNYTNNLPRDTKPACFAKNSWLEILEAKT